MASSSPLEKLNDLGQPFTHDPLADLCAIVFTDRSAEAASCRPLPSGLPFQGGWIGTISYDIGSLLEPRAVSQSINRVGRKGAGVDPIFEFAWCPDAVVYDGRNQTWYRIGDPPVDPHSNGRTPDAPYGSPTYASERRVDFELSRFEPEQSRLEVEQSIERVIEHIRAGDIFQTNLSQRFHARFGGSTRSLFQSAHRLQSSWYQAYLELDAHRSILSLSPELFLFFDPIEREIVTRPIKGTAPSTTDPRQLIASEKDAAELNMITDLMRNDLGRVCEAGTVKVDEARTIETHGTVHHGVSTIRGRLRRDRSIMDLIRATMPGGSITGAPKIRAMQIIDELESFRRGVFFGSIGYVSVSGHACFNLAIRTMRIERGLATYVAGAGIVADSTPSLEYDEMLLKAAAARGLVSPNPLVEKV